jgi:hypothetical protein
MANPSEHLLDAVSLGSGKTAHFKLVEGLLLLVAFGFLPSVPMGVRHRPFEKLSKGG